MKAYFLKFFHLPILRFGGVSLLCWSTDQIIAAILGDWLLPLLGFSSIGSIANISGYTARIISAGMNFLINRKVTFHAEEHFFGRAARYVILAVLIITLSNQGVIFLVGCGLPRAAAKVLCDFLLFFLNFAGQRFWVFR